MLNLFTRPTTRHMSNKLDYRSTESSRRQSVTPSGRSFRRHTLGVFDGGPSPSTSPPVSPVTKTQDGGDLFSTKFDQLSSLLGIRRKESLQQEYFEEWNKHATLVNEFRETMQLVEHIHRVYESTKSTHPLMRYRKLKSCVQRTHMFLQVCAVHSSIGKDLVPYYTSISDDKEAEMSFQRSIQRGSVIGSQAKEAEAQRQKEEAFEKMDYQEVQDDLNRLRDENAILTMQSKLMLAEMKWLCEKYTEIKYANPISKYFYLKKIIRRVIFGDTLREVLEARKTQNMEL